LSELGGVKYTTTVSVNPSRPVLAKPVLDFMLVGNTFFRWEGLCKKHKKMAGDEGGKNLALKLRRDM
jgi:hypothetical protein